MQKWRRRTGSIYHVSDINVYLSRQRGEGSPIKRTSLRSFFILQYQSKCWSHKCSWSEKVATHCSKWKTHYVKVDLMTVYTSSHRGRNRRPQLARGKRKDLPQVIMCVPVFLASNLHCKNHLVKMTTSEGYCSFRVHWTESKTQLSSINPLTTPSQSIKVQTASRNTCLLANIYQFICIHLLAVIRFRTR